MLSQFRLYPANRSTQAQGSTCMGSVSGSGIQSLPRFTVVAGKVSAGKQNCQIAEK